MSYEMKVLDAAAEVFVAAMDLRNLVHEDEEMATMAIEYLRCANPGIQDWLANQIDTARQAQEENER